MESLCARWPSELLAAMLEAFPPGQETYIFFTHLFLCQDVRNLVAKAEKLWALHDQKSSLIATVDMPEEKLPSFVASISFRGRVGYEHSLMVLDRYQRPDMTCGYVTKQMNSLVRTCLHLKR